MMIFKEITQKVTCCSSCGEEPSFNNTISPGEWRVTEPNPTRAMSKEDLLLKEKE